MTVSKVCKSKYIIFTMCIFIVIAAWGTPVFPAADNSNGTHFCAAGFWCFFGISPYSLAKKIPPRFVPWINYNNCIIENTFDGFVNTMCITLEAVFNIVYSTGQALRIAKACSNKKICFLRI